MKRKKGLLLFSVGQLIALHKDKQEVPSTHSWARTPRILRAREGGLLHKVRTLLQWNPEAGGGHNPDPLRAQVCFNPRCMNYGFIKFTLHVFEELGQKNLADLILQVSSFNYRLVETTMHFPYYAQLRLYEIDAPPRPRYHSRHCITIRMRVEWRRREGEGEEGETPLVVVEKHNRRKDD